MQRSQQLRTATQTRRSARTGFPEPDDFEGLPVRQWRQEWVNVAPSLQQEMAQQGDRWAVDLPYGMPRESHLLPPHTQELLRAARSGRLYKRPAPAEEEELDAEVDAVKGEKKDWEPPSEGYMVKTWKQVPRNAESPAISHLAKRHKNTVTLASKAAVPQPSGPTVIRATVRRIDAAGNPYEQTVTLAEGQQVDGEIISTTVVQTPVAAQAELPAQQATPVRRRPPPPKRKAKGPGRGRKKGKLPLPIPSTRSQAATATGELAPKAEAPEFDGIRIEDAEDSANHDSEMADVSGMPSEDEEGDGGEGEEEGEGGDEAGDEEAGETPNVDDINRDAPGPEAEDLEMSEAIQPTSIEEPEEPRPAPEEEEVVTMPKLRFQPPSLGNLGQPHAATRMEGSPLKNVMIQSPTEPPPLFSPQAASTSFSASSYLDVQSRTTVSQTYAAETTTRHGILPSLRDNRAFGRVLSQERPSATRPAEKPPAAPSPQASQASKTTTADDQQQEISDAPSGNPTATEPAKPAVEAIANTAAAPAAPQPEPQPIPEAPSLQPPDSPVLVPTVAEDEDEDDDGLNIFGSLERELDRQASASSGGSGSGSGSGGGGGDVGSDGKNTPTQPAAASGTAAPETAAAPSADEGTSSSSAADDAQPSAAAAAEPAVADPDPNPAAVGSPKE
ncbi:hypothetical protein N658DRAFT_468133 [Parathielavia hyrcaniae]|uniref:Uncharacterized protein n=1 Tax=Parathielavia hyrcaniae TaxID=113614 RepID=A0AAN6Q388_9PEZI|nr:hypothetical protein N658DRAFT_468133 [Parathielavia hyrcaniae]